MPNTSKITPKMLAWAYRQGLFPMASSRDGPVQWYAPDPRAILPLDRFHISRSLQRRVRQKRFRITFDQAFEQVIRACAEPRDQDRDTWISQEIVSVYTELHKLGMAHSVEAWSSVGREQEDQDPILVGGVYGVAIGGAFFGESMFHRATDASKVCLVHLVDHLRRCRFALLDVQFVNSHLIQFGLEEVPRDAYLQLLASAIELSVSWESPNS